MPAEIQTPVSGIQHTPLFPQKAQHPRDFSVCTYFIYQHSLFLFWFRPCNVPFPFFKRKKISVFASVCGGERRIERCALVAGLVTRGSGDRWGRGTSKQQWQSSPCFNPLSPGSGSGALAKIVGDVANIPVVCGVLGTQLLLIGAMASGDHSCGSKDLART